MLRPTLKFAFIAVLAQFIGAKSINAEPLAYIPIGEEGRIEVIDTATDRVIKTIDGLKAVHGLAGTPDGVLLIAGSYDERDSGAAPAKPEGMTQSDHEKHHQAAKTPSVNTTSTLSTVTVLDRKTGQVVSAIDVPGAVHHVAVSPDGRTAVVTHPGEDTITAIDLSSFKVITTIVTGALPNYAVFSQDGAWIFVSNSGDNTISFIKAADWKIDASLSVGASPEHLVVAPDGNTLYVNAVDDGNVSEIDIASQRIIRTFSIGQSLHGVDLADDGSALIVAIVGADAVARIDLLTGRVSKVAQPPSPYHLMSVAGTDKVYVSSSEQPRIRVLNQRDLSLISEIEIGGVGHQMVVAPSS